MLATVKAAVRSLARKCHMKPAQQAISSDGMVAFGCDQAAGALGVMTTSKPRSCSYHQAGSRSPRPFARLAALALARALVVAECCRQA